MLDSQQPEDWLKREPRPGETCVFIHGYEGLGSDNNVRRIADWKRASLLFDRVYARCLDPRNPPDIPLALSFGLADVDREVQSYDASMAQMIGQAYGTGDIEELRKRYPDQVEQLFDMTEFDSQLSSRYRQVGLMAEWAYTSNRRYLRRFTEGECVAYEGALNNLPLVSTKHVSWDHIIAFRQDPEAVRKYRDLRLWLRSGLGAQSVQHATDIIGQKIENYRWAIKKHGFQTSIGAIKQLFDWKESAVTMAVAGATGMFAGPVWGSIAAGMTVAAQVGTWVGERRLSSREILRGPDREIAILFDAQERFGK
jgi:hypothetical protein